MSQILTTKEVAQYLKLHEITICKYAAQGLIPAIRIGRVWRFDKETIDKWIQKGQQEQPAKEQPTPAEAAEPETEKPKKLPKRAKARSRKQAKPRKK